MDVSTLLQKVRYRLRDTVKPYLWSDFELIDDYAHAARTRVFKVCRNLITDSATAEDAAGLPLCSLTLVANTAKYAMSPKILRITRMKLANQSYPLPMISAAELDSAMPGWQGYAAGEPLAFCPDLDTDYITFIPAPVAIDTVSLTVYRFPLEDLASSSTELGFREEYHDDLIPGILARAYGANDSEQQNMNLSATHEKTFEDRLLEIRGELQRRTATTHTNNAPRAFRTK
jgi:hypothetical protein